MKPKRRSHFKRLIALAVAAALIYFSAFIAFIHFGGAADSATAADVILVLGAGLRHDGRPGWALTRRADAAADLWRKSLAPFVLCSGAKVAHIPRSEADACREILFRRGVPASAILLEEASRSTEEQAINSRAILDARGWSSVILVSDSYHIVRASWIFSRHGMRVAASPVPRERIRQRLFYPYSLLREFAAIHFYAIKELLNLPVTHLRGL